MINTLYITGKVTKPIRIETLPSGSIVVKFFIRHEKKLKDKVVIHEFEVEAFGKLAKAVANEIQNWEDVMITGEIRQEKWIDKEGNKKNKVKIVASRIIPLKKDV